MKNEQKYSNTDYIWWMLHSKDDVDRRLIRSYKISEMHRKGIQVHESILQRDTQQETMKGQAENLGLLKTGNVTHSESIVNQEQPDFRIPLKTSNSRKPGWNVRKINDMDEDE